MMLIVALALTGCEWGVVPKIDTPKVRVAGYVAADEPRAVRVAQDMLAQGGAVADAGVALALTLTVTLPSRAGLGGGGACLIRKGREPTQTTIFARPGPEEPLPTQSVEFLPRPGKDGGSVGLPTLIAGLYAIHAKYGKLRWEQIVAQAENMARFGVPVARAFTNDIAAAHAEISGPDGKPLAEGDLLPQNELAVSFAALRTRGARDLYAGQLAASYVAASGGEIDAASLRAVTPAWQELKGVPFGNDVAYFSATPGGAFAESLWRGVSGERSGAFYERVLRTISGDSGKTRENVLQRALAVADTSPGLLPGTPPPGVNEGDAATGFVVVDYQGAALACTLTMGRLFGAGRLVGQTGILASVAVPGPHSDGISGAALLVTNDNTRKLLGAFAAGGDRSGAQALVETALNALASPLSLDQAMLTPRIFAAGAGSLLAEPGLPLGNRPVTETTKLGAVNGITCASGLPSDKQDCAVETDPRGSGLTAEAQRKR